MVGADRFYRAERDNPDPSLVVWPFASDDKEEKGTARTMLRMVADINGKYLANVGEPRAADTPAVTCYTCHRGSRTPLTAPEPKR